MKTALVYDRVNKWGGAERVLLELNKIFPEAPLYCSVYDEKRANWAKVFPKVVPSFLNKAPFLRANHEYLGTLTPIAFESFTFDEFDFVISVSSEAAKGIITKPKTLHINYCLTPTRYLWSEYETYFANPFLRFFSKPAVSYLRVWDKIAASRPDIYIANSNNTKKRIKKYYGRNSTVIYSPVDITKFSKGAGKTKKKDYYLIVSRLTGYKKVDIAINAFNKLGKKLIVVGTGKDEYRLKSLARENIEFEGYVDEVELVNYYHKAKAVIFPQTEDFGLVPIEAQAAGTPVIAYKKGGALETVNAKTGVFFNTQTPEDIIKAVQKFVKRKFTKKDLQKNAARFSQEKFRKQFEGVLSTHINKKFIGKGL